MCIVKILRIRKLYPTRFITQLVLCATRIMICPARLVTRLELKCNSFCIQTRVAISNYSKSFSIIRNDLRLLEMNSSHSKTVFTLLALRPLQDDRILSYFLDSRVGFVFQTGPRKQLVNEQVKQGNYLSGKYFRHLAWKSSARRRRMRKIDLFGTSL